MSLSCARMEQTGFAQGARTSHPTRRTLARGPRRRCALGPATARSSRMAQCAMHALPIAGVPETCKTSAPQTQSRGCFRRARASVCAYPGTMATGLSLEPAHVRCACLITTAQAETTTSVLHALETTRRLPALRPWATAFAWQGIIAWASDVFSVQPEDSVQAGSSTCAPRTRFRQRGLACCRRACATRGSTARMGIVPNVLPIASARAAHQSSRASSTPCPLRRARAAWRATATAATRA